MNKSSSEILYDAALQLSNAGDDQLARDLLSKVILESPDYPPAYLLLGLIQKGMDDVQKAEEYFRKALELDADYGEALQSLGLLLISKGQLEEGVEYLKTYLEKNNWGDEKNLEVLISSLNELNREAEAGASLKQAWGKTNNYRVGVLYATHLVKDSENADQGFELLEQISRDEDLPDLHYELATLYVKYFSESDALPHLERAAEFIGEFYFDEEEEMNVISSLIEAYLAEKNGEKALEWLKTLYNKSIDIFGYDSDTFIHVWEVDALMLLERYQEAIDLASRLIKEVQRLEDEEKYASWYSRLFIHQSEAFEMLGNSAQAIDALKSGIKLFPQVGSLYRKAYKYLDPENHPEQAARLLEKALEIGISDYHKEWLYEEYFIQTARADLLEESWKHTEPYFQVLDEEDFIRFLDALRAQFIEDPKRAAQIFAQIDQRFPNRPACLLFLSWFLTRLGSMADAEEVLNRALGNNPSLTEECYLQANLGYLQLVQMRLSEARSTLEKIVQIMDSEEKSVGWYILGIANYINNQVMRDDNPILNHSYQPHAAAQANLVTLAQAEGINDEAMTHALLLLWDEKETNLGYEMLGFISLARGDLQAARLAWELAKPGVQDQIQIGVIQKRIKELIPYL